MIRFSFYFASISSPPSRNYLPSPPTCLTRDTLGDPQHLQHRLIAHDELRHGALAVLVIVELDLLQHCILLRRAVVHCGPLALDERRYLVSTTLQRGDLVLYLTALGLDRGADCRVGRAVEIGCRGGPCRRGGG